MTVSILDSSIESMNHKLCFLILTDLSAGIDRLLFRFVVTAGVYRSAFLNIPPAIGVGDDVVS